MSHKKEWNILFLLFDYIEVLDFSGSFDVFSMANVPIPPKPGEKPNYDQGHVFKLHTVSELGETITALHGLKIEPDYSFETCPNDIMDVLIIPGASPVFIKELIEKKPQLVAWVAERLKDIPIVASVCVGALILAKAGGFNGLQCTTHHAAIADLNAILQAEKANATVIPGVRYVDNSDTKNPRILSSAGVSAGIDQAFYMLREILGNATLASSTATIMEYNETYNRMYSKVIPVPWNC